MNMKLRGSQSRNATLIKEPHSWPRLYDQFLMEYQVEVSGKLYIQELLSVCLD